MAKLEKQYVSNELQSHLDRIARHEFAEMLNAGIPVHRAYSALVQAASEAMEEWIDTACIEGVSP